MWFGRIVTDVDPTGQFIYDTMFTRGGTAMYEGPYWRDDAVTVYQGDCLDVLKLLAPNSVDAVVTDPPYKPLEGTVAANVQKHGVGALNVDACRIATSDNLGGGANKGMTSDTRHEGFARPWMDDDETREAAASRSRENTARAEALGRWPTNVVLDTDTAEQLDKQSGTSVSRIGTPTPRDGGRATNFAMSLGGTTGYEDSGGASRFFPTFKYEPKAPGTERPTADGIAHPTVKPVDLMRWLVRLVTPPHGLILDPFAGTGTTGEAAIHEHKHAILIEREMSYMPLIIARLHKPIQTGFDFDQEPA
jgi:DNA methylase